MVRRYRAWFLVPRGMSRLRRGMLRERAHCDNADEVYYIIRNKADDAE